MRAPSRPWSLRTRLVVSAVVLIAVVAAVIGTVTTIALHSYLQGKLDTQLGEAVQRAGDAQGRGFAQGGERGPLDFVAMPGRPKGTVGAEVTPEGRIESGVRSNDRSSHCRDENLDGLTSEQAGVLDSVPRDGRTHTVTLPGLGDYRVRSTPDGTLVLGFPLTEVRSTVGTLVLVEVCVTAAGLVAAGIAGVAMVGMALRPLNRVAGTATRVSELPLHRGEVALHERVPPAEADPRTEVGQVGAALNRMLGHVGSALAARQESETRVRRFVADASHELRTPLASIRGYAELTRRGGEPAGPDTRHALARIESEAVRMTDLVEDLLLLARLDAGRPLSYETTDVSTLLVDAVSDARAAGPGHHWRLELPVPGAEMAPRTEAETEAAMEAAMEPRTEADTETHTDTETETHTDADTGPCAASPAATRLGGEATAPASTSTPAPTLIRGDAARLHQVLVNLLGNARTHTPDGTTVTARVRRDGPAVVRVEIQDDGPGIPPGLLPYVFERFARGDASRSRAAGSTGLGLAIAQSVVVAHGGTIAVDSVPGRTVFAVRLPAVAGVPSR